MKEHGTFTYANDVADLDERGYFLNELEIARTPEKVSLVDIMVQARAVSAESLSRAVTIMLARVPRKYLKYHPG